MSSQKVLVFAIFAIALGLAEAKSTKQTNAWYAEGTPNFAYDCSEKEDGNYPHPTLCTHYVACVAKAYAYEMVCALNHDGKPLHYVASSGPDPRTSHCDYPEVAGCEGPEPEKPTTTAPEVTTTRAPEVTTTRVPEPTTTRTPEVPTTAAPEVPPPTQAPPTDECREHDCRQVGNCTAFEVCQNGQWQERECGEDLFWNSEIDNGFGGECDYYNNLSDNLKTKYIQDKECIPPCEWWQLDEERCTGTYHFRSPFDNQTLQGRESTLTCSKAPAGSSVEDLIWNPATLTCDRRAAVNGCGP